MFFSPNSVSTLRGSYGSCKGWCLIRVLQLVRGIFPVNFRIKWLLSEMLMRILTAQARTKCGPRFWVAAFFRGGLGRKSQAFYESEEGGDRPLPSEEKDDDDQNEARFSPCEGGEAGDGETTKKGWSSSASTDPGETRAGWRSPGRRSGPKHRALHDDWSLEPSQTWTREGWDAKRSLIRQLVTKLIQCRNPGGYLGV